MQVFDVVIVGAGPAGSLLAYYLGQNGIDTLLLEKKKLPRYKPCGGGLTRRALHTLPFDIDAVIEDRTHTAKLYFDRQLVFTKKAAQPLVAMIMRDRFDHFLAKQAAKQGAILKDQTACDRFAQQNDLIQIATSRGTFATKILVGADGVNSRVASQSGLALKTKHMIALEAELEINRRETLDEFRHSFHFDFGVIPKGYGWLFPKLNHFSVGILSVKPREKNLRRYFDNYLQHKRLIEKSTLRSLKAHFIPYAPDKNNRLASHNVLVVGDAAGLVDPITGEGIYYALQSGHMAANIIMGHLTDSLPLKQYERWVQSDLIPELDCARKLSCLLYHMPGISRRILHRHAYTIGNNHLKIICGEISYRQLYREVFSPAGILRLLTPKRPNPSK